MKRGSLERERFKKEAKKEDYKVYTKTELPVMVNNSKKTKTKPKIIVNYVH